MWASLHSVSLRTVIPVYIARKSGVVYSSGHVEDTLAFVIQPRESCNVTSWNVLGCDTLNVFVSSIAYIEALTPTGWYCELGLQEIIKVMGMVFW